MDLNSIIKEKYGKEKKYDKKTMNLKDVQEYLKAELNEERVEYLYNMITDAKVRINDNDKPWVAFCTDPLENRIVIDAISKIIGDDSFDTVIEEFVEDVGTWFVKKEIQMKPRLPFYVLVLDKIYE